MLGKMRGTRRTYFGSEESTVFKLLYRDNNKNNNKQTTIDKIFMVYNSHQDYQYSS